VVVTLALATASCAKHNVAEVVAGGGCPRESLERSSCPGAAVATTDGELRAVRDEWGYDLDMIRARVPDLWNYTDDVLKMPDDGRVVVLLGANDANDCETVVHELSVRREDRGSTIVVAPEASEE
jgi:hypothetical protein